MTQHMNQEDLDMGRAPSSELPLLIAQPSAILMALYCGYLSTSRSPAVSPGLVLLFLCVLSTMTEVLNTGYSPQNVDTL